MDLYEWLDAHGAPSDPETGFPWDEFGLLASPYPTVPAADVAQALLDHVRADIQARAAAYEVDLACAHSDWAVQETYSGELYHVCQDCGAERRSS